MRDVVSSLTATALIQASNIATGILLARFLQPDGRGELAAVMLWPTVIAIVGIFGLHEAIAYYAARRQHGAQSLLRGGLLLGGGLCLILLPIGGGVAHALFADKSPDIGGAAFLYLAFIPLNFAGLFLVGLFQGALRFSAWNLLRTSVGLFYLVFILLLHFAGFGGVAGFALASLLANAGMVALAVVMYWRSEWPAAPRQDSAQSVRRDLIRYGVSVHFGAAVAFIAERLDQMIISIALPAADLGLFVIATTLSRLPLVLASTLATVAFPKIASMGGDAERAMVFGRYARVTTLTILPLSLALAMAMPWLLPFFFGASFAEAIPVAWLQTAAAVPLSLKTMMSGGFKACNRSWIVGQAEIVTLVLSAGALAVLVPSYGLMGAAVAGIIAQGGALAFMMIRAKQALAIAPGELLLPRAADLALIMDTAKELRDAMRRTLRPR